VRIRSLITVPLLLGLCVGCMPKAKHTILVPADKPLSEAIGSINVQNNTDIQTDAVAAVRVEIKDSPRVTLVKPSEDPDAVVTLMSVKVQDVVRDCKKESKESATASLDYSIVFKWKMENRGKAYDQHVMKDRGSETRSRTNCAEAKSALPGNQKQIASAHNAWGIGEGYAHRLFPFKRTLKRKYYPAGNDNLKKAGKMVKNDNWKGAVQVWTTVVANAKDPKIKGRANFNLAVFYERQAKYDSAVDHMTKAKKQLDNGSSRKYLAMPKYRQKRAKQSANQMKPITGK
jgi:hypothetical protein